MIGALGSLLSGRIGLWLSAGLLVALFVSAALLRAEKRHSAKIQTALNQTVAAYDQFRADVNAKTAEAQRIDRENKARVDTAQRQERQESSHAYDALRARYNDALGRLRSTAAATHTGSGDNQGVPGTAGTAGSTVAAGQGAFVSEDDLSICADNTAAAKTWQDWWMKVSAIPR